MNHRFLCWMLGLCAALSLTVLPAFAEEYVPPLLRETEGEDREDDLFDRYVADLFGILPDSGIDPNREDFGGSEESRLTPEQKELYLKLKPMILEVARGERTSTEFDLGGYYPAAADWDSVTTVIHTLEHDYPLSLYWSGYSYAIYDDRPEYEGYTGTKVFFVVSERYRPKDDPDNMYVFDPSVLNRVNAALRNAQQIVAANASKSDYAKLKAYMEQICELVSYDHHAAGLDSYILQDSDPWNLVSVFDGDPATNVVCMGYALSFQYLCDRTDWRGDIECYSVTGDLDGGYHIWNIVRIGQASYLVDVTGCDYEYNGSGMDLSGVVCCTELYFLVGGVEAEPGSWTVTTRPWPIPGTAQYVPSFEVHYVCSKDALAVYPDRVLRLSPTAYDPDGGGRPHGTCSASEDYAPENTSVTLTLSPDPGYQAGAVSVTGSNGQSVQVSGGGNRWSFLMPAFDVFVNVTFVKIT